MLNSVVMWVDILLVVVGNNFVVVVVVVFVEVLIDDLMLVKFLVVELSMFGIVIM